MKLTHLLLLDFNGSELDESYLQQIDELVEKRTRSDLAVALAEHTEADGVLLKLGAKFGKAEIDVFPNLKYIGMLGTGYGGIDTEYAASKGITVTNIADYATEGVAEFTFGILLEHYREIAKARSQAKSGDYSDNFTGTEIKGKKFGAIGLGDIGLRTTQLAQAFGAEVSYWSRNRKPDAETKGIAYQELDELIKESDIVTLNLAYNSETEGIISAERIAQFKQNAVVINPSPMELVDFEALLARLKQNDLTFMLDHSDEMTDEQLKVLQPLDNAVVYPAIAYLTSEATALKKQIFVDNIEGFLDGELRNKVN